MPAWPFQLLLSSSFSRLLMLSLQHAFSGQGLQARLRYAQAFRKVQKDEDPFCFSLLYLQLSGLTNFLLNHSFTFLWYMYTPSRKTLWSFSLTLVACSMFAAVCATPSREGPDTTISSPSTLTFVLSPTIFAILGDLSP